MELGTLTNHIIICGWNSNALTVLKELDSLYSSEMKFKVVISEQDSDFSVGQYSSFFNADFTKMDNLEKAQISEADSSLFWQTSRIKEQIRMLMRVQF